jgi:hypothetical protein
MQSDQNSSFQTLLQESTLRLNSQDDYGTGFFVAPGFVLTCKHVIGKSHRGSCIKANWNGQEVEAKVVGFLETYDIALLSVNLVNHPCVFLDKKEVEIGQRLYTYGYPEKGRDGDSTSPKYEGLSDKGRLLTLSGGNIRPGFSGSPVLNVQTQKVCAMTAKDRHRGIVEIQNKIVTAPIGGQAIPADIILSSWHELINNTWAVEFIFSMKLIGILGRFADSITLKENFVNPWTMNTSSPRTTQYLNQIILKWAKKLHFSFLSVEINNIEGVISNIYAKINIQEQDLHNCFSVSQGDMRWKIVSQFANQNYKAVAPFDHCVYMFLFLCTNNYIFVDMIGAELIRKKFIDFAKNSVKIKLSNIYANQKILS